MNLSLQTLVSSLVGKVAQQAPAMQRPAAQPEAVSMARDTRVIAQNNESAQVSSAIAVLKTQQQEIMQTMREHQGELATATPEATPRIQARLEELQYLKENVQSSTQALQRMSVYLKNGGKANGHAAEMAQSALRLATATPEEAPLLKTRLENAAAQAYGAPALPRLNNIRESMAIRLGDLSNQMRMDAMNDGLSPRAKFARQSELAALYANVDAASRALGELQKSYQRTGAPHTAQQKNALNDILDSAERLLNGVSRDSAEQVQILLEQIRQART